MPLTMSGGSHTVTDTFGVHIDATYCNDGQIDSDLEEREIPPGAPPIFGFIWVDHRSGSQCMGLGQTNHIQEPGKRDTFKLQLIPVGDSIYPITFTWPRIPIGWSTLVVTDSSGDSVSLIDMLTDSSIRISDQNVRYLVIVGESILLDAHPATWWPRSGSSCCDKCM